MQIKPIMILIILGYTMLIKPDPADEEITSCLRNAYGLNVGEISFLPLGADLNTAVYRVTTSSKKDYFDNKKKKKYYAFDPRKPYVAFEPSRLMALSTSLFPVN